MRSRLLSALSLTATASLMLAGCGAADSEPTDPAGQPGGTSVSVLAAFYPFEFVDEQVGGDTVAVENLTPTGGEPHDLELTPQQVGALTEAELLVYLEGFQPAVDRAVEQAPPADVLEVTSVVPLEDTGAMDAHGHGGGEDGEGSHSDEVGDEHSDRFAGDPHLWLDPTRLAQVATAVGERLAEIDDANADTYRANAEELVAELQAIDEEYAEGLRGCERDTFVVSHSAFGYIAARYDLEQIGISGLSPEDEPSPARIAEVQKVAAEEGITTIFYETLVSPDVAQMMADDLGVTTAVLDPLEGLTDSSPGQDYVEIMRANLEQLRAANGCS